MTYDYVALMVRSLEMSLLSLALSTVPAIGLGYVFARHPFRGRIWLESIVMLPLILPPVVSGFFLLYLFAPSGPAGALLDWAFDIRVPFTFAAGVLAASVISFPLYVRGAKLGFAGVAREFEEVAATLGHRPWAVFFKVSLPLARRGIAAGLILALARALGEFGATLIVAGNIPGRTQTLSLAIYQATQSGHLEAGWILIGISVAIAIVLMTVASRLERA
jgi:molybdate transport system permease protein